MLNNAPNKWTITEIVDHIKQGPQAGFSDGTYEPSRPIGYSSLKSRLRLAWAVFVGTADVLFWPRQERP